MATTTIERAAQHNGMDPNQIAPSSSTSTSLQSQQTDRPGRRRPFSTWMKRLTNFKGSSAADPNQPVNTKRNGYNTKSHSKKLAHPKNNNPYPESGIKGGTHNGHRSFSTVPTGLSISASSLDRSHSLRSSVDGLAPPTSGNKSTAATISTDIAHSDTAGSHGASSGQATHTTIGNSGRGVDSTFSSPAPSVRSLATTLTTIHSATPNAGPTSHHTGNNTQSVQFSHQFPTSPPPNALPAHLLPQGSGGHPATYGTATANNLLTDNASILTLASSSKRRRRRSMDTDASVRALAPSSLFGGSRESLPLSVLSASIDTAPHQIRPSVAGVNERASIYSATGVAPALPSERNSFYAGKQAMGADGASIKSGLLRHGRNDSISGSIGGVEPAGSPLASPREASSAQVGRVSRSNSAWGAETAEEDEENPKSHEGEAR